MSNLPVETTEPDPAATSISNDQTVNKEASDASAPTNTETVMADTEPAKSNGASEAKTEKADVDMEKNGEDTPVKKEQNGDSPKAKREHHDKKGYNNHRDNYRKPYGKNQSKFDPSVLPESNDAGEIRGQVGKIKKPRVWGSV
jgi:lupus La protein